MINHPCHFDILDQHRLAPDGDDVDRAFRCFGTRFEQHIHTPGIKRFITLKITEQRMKT